MKKYGVIVLALLLSMPAISFAQQKESKKEKIARLEAENTVYQQQVAVLQQQLDRTQHRADSLTNVAGEKGGQIIVLSSENERLKQNIDNMQKTIEEQIVQIDKLKKLKQQQKVQVSAPHQAKTQAKPTAIPTFLREDIEKKCSFYSDKCPVWAKQMKKQDPSFQVINYENDCVGCPSYTEKDGYIGDYYSTIFSYISNNKVQQKEFGKYIK